MRVWRCRSDSCDTVLCVVCGVVCVVCGVWCAVLSGVSEVQVYYRDDGRIMLKGEGAREEKALPPT